ACATPTSSCATSCWTRSEIFISRAGPSSARSAVCARGTPIPGACWRRCSPTKRLGATPPSVGRLIKAGRNGKAGCCSSAIRPAPFACRPVDYLCYKSLMRLAPSLRSCVLTASIGVLAACGSTKKEAYVEKPVDDLYNKAMDELVEERYQIAAKTFEE